MATSSLFKTYLSLTKPGVLFGNAFSAAAGFLVISVFPLNWELFLALLGGSTLIIASACTLNNYFDRDIDSLMTRTKVRVVASGQLPGKNAVVFGLILGILGFALLFLYTNTLTVLLGGIGFVTYLVFYGMLGKRRSMHGTLVGSVSGAIPILAGYTAVTGVLDLGGILLFLILFFWQLPEFYAIAIYRHDEYKKAGIPVISVVKGISTTKLHILIYTILFVLCTLLLFLSGLVGYTYLIIIGILDLIWLKMAIDGFMTNDTTTWAKKMFRHSLIILLAFCLLLCLEVVLP